MLFPFPNSSQILQASLPTQVHALSFFLSLENRQISNNKKLINNKENREKTQETHSFYILGFVPEPIHLYTV